MDQQWIGSNGSMDASWDHEKALSEWYPYFDYIPLVESEWIIGVIQRCVQTRSWTDTIIRPISHPHYKYQTRMNTFYHDIVPVMPVYMVDSVDVNRGWNVLANPKSAILMMSGSKDWINRLSGFRSRWMIWLLWRNCNPDNVCDRIIWLMCWSTCVRFVR